MDDCLELVMRVVQGDGAAWTALQALLDPVIVRIARGHRGLRRKGLSEQIDELAEVRTAALQRLAANDFHNLRAFSGRAEGHARPQSFDSWLYGVVDYVIRDHLRMRFGRAPKLTAAGSGAFQPSKRDLQSHAGSLDDECLCNLLNVVGVTTRLTIAEVLAFIAANFEPTEAHAVQLYFAESRSYAEIAEALAMSGAKEAEQLIRRLNARLRYRFAPQDASS